LQPIDAAAEDASVVFDFPSPKELRPPLIVLDDAQAGYVAGAPVLSRLNLRIDPDDRIALVGRNGNGKTTLARLLAGRLSAAVSGVMSYIRIVIRLKGHIRLPMSRCELDALAKSAGLARFAHRGSISA
jgi:ATP-binding cassette subfamily F protein 3